MLSNLKKHFDLNQISEVYFWKSQWEKFDPADISTPISIYYFIYRTLYLCWFLGTYIYFFTCPCGPSKFFIIYLTTQTYTLQLGYSMLYFAYISWRWYRQLRQRNRVFHHPEESLTTRGRRDGNHLPLCAKIILIVMNIVLAIPYAITATYWIFLKKEQIQDTVQVPESEIGYRKARNQMFHTFNSLAALLESLIVAFPIKFTHFVFAMSWGLWYSVFSAAYELTNSPLPGNSTTIYSITDWKGKPGRTIIWSIGGMIGAAIYHAIFCWATYLLRLHLSKIIGTGPRQLTPEAHAEEDNQAVAVVEEAGHNNVSSHLVGKGENDSSIGTTNP